MFYYSTCRGSCFGGFDIGQRRMYGADLRCKLSKLFVQAKQPTLVHYVRLRRGDLISQFLNKGIE